MFKILLISFLLIFEFINFSFASECQISTIGTLVCANGGGTAVKTNAGEIVCGIGKCTFSNIGEIICSKKPNGTATKNNVGEIFCVGGCEYASKSNCSTLEKFK